MFLIHDFSLIAAVSLSACFDVSERNVGGKYNLAHNTCDL